MKKIILFLIISISYSCSNSSEDNINYDQINETEIKEYLIKNNLIAQKSSSGLYYIINNEGTGSSPSINSTINVDYKGSLLNDEIFDTATNVSLIVKNLISGFKEGIQYIKEEGDITLLIPSKLGYANQQVGNIPPGSVLIFNIKLLSIN